MREYPVTAGAVLQRKVGPVKAVSDVTLHVNAGEALGLVGESGCGKTTLGKLIVGIEKPDAGPDRCSTARRSSRCGGRALRRARRDLQMMFQDSVRVARPADARAGDPARAAVDPGDRHAHGAGRSGSARMLDEVGLPHNALERYPHEFSGGQRQRIALARALMLEPKVIVADEPVSALDVSIRSQVLNLMKRLQAEHDMASVVISHDLAVVKYLADRIGVMYLGKLVELGTGDDIYRRPAHPYTEALIKTIPVPDPAAEHAKTDVGDPRRAAEPDRPALGLPLPHALPARAGRSAPRSSRRCGASARATRRPATSRSARPPRSGRRRATPQPCRRARDSDGVGARAVARARPLR